METNEKFLADISRLIHIISVLEKDDLELAKPMARRMWRLSKKLRVDSDLQAALGILAEGIIKSMALSGVKAHAQKAIEVVLKLEEQLEKIKEEKIIAEIQNKMKKGKIQTYGRFMTKTEYKRLRTTRMLESADASELIACFDAPKHVIERFVKISRRAVHNFYTSIGGSGDIDYIVFFKTDIQPAEGPIALKRTTLTQEFKFYHSTPIIIIQARRV